MKRLWMMAVAVLVSVPGAHRLGAQTPAGATGQCNDGSYTSASKKWQACGGHQGVKAWFADAKGGASTASGAAAAPSSAAAKAVPAPAAKGTASGAKGTVAPGGGPGLVWLNSSTNVYHCPGGPFYGKTKDGKYVSEADAKKAGARPDHNKPCGK